MSPISFRPQRCRGISMENPSAQVDRSFQAGYQQAMSDFAVTDLLQHLRTYSDANFDAKVANLSESEVETLAAVLIQALVESLTGKLLTEQLSALRHYSLYTLASLSQITLAVPNGNLPNSFPTDAPPRFFYGDHLCWKDDDARADWGTVIGRFYGFASHCGRWCWCYLIWLDSASPSASWVRADVAWEDDLDVFEQEPT
jgi:hypothetical protein